MIICISGSTGSGKTAISNKLSEVLKIRHVHNSYKKSISGDYNNVISFTRNATSSFAKNFDKNIVKEAMKQDCVVSTWLGPWMIKKADLRVLLYADAEVRAMRKAKELKIPKSKAIEYLRERDLASKEHFKKVYGININDTSIFDICINTGKMDIEKIVSVISLLSIEKGKNKFE
jgi:cytidylate kinase